MHDGLREVEEELGKQYNPEQLTYLGRKININTNTKGQLTNHIIDIFMTTDDSALDTYTLQEKEVYAICICPINKLVAVHETGSAFDVQALRHDGATYDLAVTQDSFPYNWDPYHHKIALLARRHLTGETNLLY